jgi:putative ABC transport system permease protein
MNWLTFLKQSVLFYRRQYLGIFLGTALAAAVLTGALLAGDSVKQSLIGLVDLRLGKIQYALTLEERFFSVDLAQGLESELGTNVAPVLRMAGIAVENETGLRLNNVQVLGVDSRFWQLGQNQEPVITMDAGQAVLNAPLARRLNLNPGQELVLLIEQPEYMPGDTPFSSRQNATVALHLTVKAVAGDERLGRFSLANNQVSPLSVFLPLETLQSKLKMKARANLLLVSERKLLPLKIEELDRAIKARITLSDFGAELKEQRDNTYFDLVSRRIFIEPALERAALSLEFPARPILTYFVNSMGFEGKTCPYSFVSAPGIPLSGRELKADEIVISRWLAQDLGAKSGDKIELKYYIPGRLNTLEEHSASFTIQSIIEIKPTLGMQSLMPDFPGLAEVKNCRDWHPGIEIDLTRIRKKDEAYWNTFGGTPKAFLNLEAAQKLWQNRFGRLTALRFSSRLAARQQIERQLLGKLDPKAFGFVFQPVKKLGLESAGSGVDFGGLFLGLSLFIIVSALVLSSMLNIFHRQSRLTETGILKAVGTPIAVIQRLAVGEGAVITLLAACFGGLLGILYTRFLILGLDTIWQQAVGQLSLQFMMDPWTLLKGFALSFLTSLVSLWLPLRRYAGKSVIALQSQTLQYNPPLSPGRPVLSAAAAGFCLVLSGLFIYLSSLMPEFSTEFFFFIGFCTLCALLFFLSTLFTLAGRKKSKPNLSLLTVGLKNAARRKSRSLLTVSLLGVGIFCVIVVGANQQELPATWTDRSSGTGGFAFFGETTLPLLENLNDPKVKKRLHLDENSLAGVSFVQIKVRAGDDASCLNLNKAARPRLLGVDAVEFAGRKAFSFQTMLPGLRNENPWLNLEDEMGEGIIPAVADQTIIVWGLNKKIGDELELTDELGKGIKLKLIGGLKNSVFQGSILISEKQFVKHFPSTSGYNIFLVEAISQNLDPAGQTLSSSLKAYGLELVSAGKRLAQFQVVENTYLSMFLLLGGLALVLGTAGLGVIILRNTAESRNQYALLQALGFSRKSVTLLIFYEHIFLLLAAITGGALSAGLALIPQFARADLSMPFTYLGILLLGLFLSGTLWLYLGAKQALKGDLLDALRTE